MTGNEENPPTPGGGSSDQNAGASPAANGGKAEATPAPAVKPERSKAEQLADKAAMAAAEQAAKAQAKAGKTTKVKGGDVKAGKPAKDGDAKAADTKAGKPAGQKSKAGRNAAVAVGVAALLLVVGAAAEPYAPGAAAIDLAMSGEGDMVNAESLKNLTFTVTGTKKDLVLKLDGQEVQATPEGDAMVYKVADLSEGKHTFTATAKGRLPGRKVTTEKSFEIDKTAPTLTLEAPTAKDLKSEVVLAGKADGADKVTINGETVEVKDGAFSKTFSTALAGVKVEALDAAGNKAEKTIDVVVKHPGMRAVHMTALAWKTPSLRDPVIQMIKDKKIDTVQLDIKDEDGKVGYLSEVPLAKEIGATYDYYNLTDAVKQIHDLGARVTGRIVAFRDPLLAGWAVKNGKMGYIVQDSGGNAFDAGSYGKASFTSLASPEVRQYNIDLAVESAKAGMDDIMYDYIRRPETRTGTLDGQVFPGIGDRTPEEAIADFCKDAQTKIREAGAFVGAAVYGISSFTPFSVAQNIPMMAKYLDFISPMVYPSHWGPNEFAV
jgi:hypothetical protein